MSTRKGLSLHIGVNVLDPAGYPCKPPHPDFPNGWTGELESCEADAIALQEMANNIGFESTLLKTRKATSENVTTAIKAAADSLEAGDIFMITYAGHGGQVIDVSKDEREGRRRDIFDETWCLYDRQFIDDELYVLFSQFRKGVRILVLLDCCHSGTAVRSSADDQPGNGRIRTRQMLPSSVEPLYFGRKAEYDAIQKNLPRVKPSDVKASIRLLAACQDNQEANCDENSGFFTYSLLEVWDDGNFAGANYDEFFTALTERLDYWTGDSETRAAGGDNAEERHLQTPNHLLEGARDPEFDSQKPFTI